MDHQPVGLDLSLTSTGIASAYGEAAIKSKARGMERLHEICLAVEDHMRDYEHRVVLFIEGYSFGSRQSHAHALGELGGVIRHRQWLSGVPYVDVPPTVLKKFATGKGNANKATVVSNVSLRTGRAFDSDDIVDAFVLMSIGAVLLGQKNPMGKLPAVNMAALDSVELPELAA